MIAPLLVEIADATSVGEVRRRCGDLASRIGFDETAAGRVALIATEIASNLARHAHTGGRVVCQATEQRGRRAVELLGIDSGPGIRNIAQALRDGYSSGTTPGTGLGAVQRLADEFQLHSVPGSGTVVLARLFESPAAFTGASRADGPASGASSSGVPFDDASAGVGSGERGAVPDPALEIGALAVPAPGEPASGDAWATERRGDRTWITVVDGLGHGPDAAVAARTAIRAFHENVGAAPAEHVRAMHAALRSTRGAAVAVVEIRHDSRDMSCAGLGNIAASVIPPEGRAYSMVSHDGIAGHVAARVQEFTYAWPAGALLVMHSDGISQRWDLGGYLGLALRDPSIIAAVLLRDHLRGRDDATVVVAREPLRGGGLHDNAGAGHSDGSGYDGQP